MINSCHDDHCIIVFSRAPMAGLSKTRLLAQYGPLGAANIAHTLLMHTMEKLLAGHEHQVDLCCTPAVHPIFLSIKRQYKNSRLDFSTQSNGSLGRRMFKAAKRNLAKLPLVVLIGTDSPELNLIYIETALDKLRRGCPVVIGPAYDGGYVLLGLRQAYSRLFQNVSWGSERVLQQTIRNCQRVGVDPDILMPLADIDFPRDWCEWKYKL